MADSQLRLVGSGPSCKWAHAGESESVIKLIEIKFLSPLNGVTEADRHPPFEFLEVISNKRFSVFARGPLCRGGWEANFNWTPSHRHCVTLQLLESESCYRFHRFRAFLAPLSVIVYVIIAVFANPFQRQSTKSQSRRNDLKRMRSTTTHQYRLIWVFLSWRTLNT